MSYKPLLKLNGKDFTKLTKYEVEYNKLYAADAHRDMAGIDRSTLIGIFPKIKCTTGKLKGADIAFLQKLSQNPSFTVEWYDHAKGRMSSGRFYMNDPSFSMKRYSDTYYEPIQFNLIAQFPYS